MSRREGNKQKGREYTERKGINRKEGNKQNGKE
jgi:hypothetical protein